MISPTCSLDHPDSIQFLSSLLQSLEQVITFLVVPKKTRNVVPSLLQYLPSHPSILFASWVSALSYTTCLPSPQPNLPLSSNDCSHIRDTHMRCIFMGSVFQTGEELGRGGGGWVKLVTFKSENSLKAL